MTEIVDGKYITNELSSRSMGGTEQMALRMVKHLPQSLLQDVQIIHSRVRDLIPNKKRILVCHDLPNDPEVAKLSNSTYRKQFNKIVFVSNWQAQMYSAMLQIPYSEFIVIPNAIEQFDNLEPKRITDKWRFIYHTTPHRGLNIAYDVLDKLSEDFSISLDVFSSFSLYGWEQRDKPYEQLFKNISDHPNMTYHGGASNAEVRSTLSDSSMNFFIYPSIWMETSCIAAIEAMSAGVIPIVPNLAALSETCHGLGPVTYQFNEDLILHKQICYQTIRKYIQGGCYLNDSSLMSSWANKHYNVKDQFVGKWTQLLEEIKK